MRNLFSRISKSLLVALSVILTIPLLFLSPTKAQSVEVVTLYAVADAIVYSGEENTNYGSMDVLEVGHSPSMDTFRQSFVKFDLSSIPNNAVITTARFRNNLVFCEGDMNTILTGQVTSNWNEYTVTWKTMPSFVSGPSRNAICDNVEWWGFDVKQIVENWRNGENNYGFTLYSNSLDGNLRRFNSREVVNQSNRPQLSIEYTLPNGDTYTTTPDNSTPDGNTDPVIPGDSSNFPDGTIPPADDNIREPEFDIFGNVYDQPYFSPIFSQLGECLICLCCLLVPFLLIIVIIILLRRKSTDKESTVIYVDTSKQELDKNPENIVEANVLDNTNNSKSTDAKKV